MYQVCQAFFEKNGFVETGTNGNDSHPTHEKLRKFDRHSQLFERPWAEFSAH